MKPDVSIIIVNWNGGTVLRNCLASLARGQKGITTQVIVVDNASRDGSREMAEKEFPQFQVINSGANLGFGRANNLARTYAQSDLILFLNPDTEVYETSLQPMVEFIHHHPEVGAVGCRMLYQDGQVQEQGLQYFPSPWTEFLNLVFISSESRALFESRLPRLDPNQSAYAIKLYGGCLLCRRTVLDKVGWFDDRYFMYAEDVDLCRSIRDQGSKLYYLATATIMHIAGGVSRKAPSGFAVLMKCESIEKMMRKYYGGAGALIYRAGNFVGSMFRLTLLLVLTAVSWIVPSWRKKNWPSALGKHRLIALWALGLKKAEIAQ